MLRRTVLKGNAATTASGLLAHTAAAETPLKIGISMPLTGAGFNAVGRQLQAALKFYMQQHGDTVAGRQIQITIRDDGGVADNARRIYFGSAIVGSRRMGSKEWQQARRHPGQ
jgi:branched-chain amino acid transport system substrate-binding protein